MTRTTILESKRLPVLFAVASGAFVALPAQAQESDHNFKIFGGAAYVSPLSDSSLSGIASSVEASSEYGWEIGGEWKASDRIGIEAAYLDAKHDVEADGTVIGDVSLRPWNFTLNWHVLNGDTFNWYVGPTLSYIDWSSIELNNGAQLDVDSDTTYGLSTGVDIGLGDTFAIQLGLRWLDASVDAPALPDSVSVDPLFMRLGVALRF